MSSDAMKMHILHTPIIFVECIVMKRSSESISVWNVAAHSRALLQTKHFSFNHIRGGKKIDFHSLQFFETLVFCFFSLLSCPPFVCHLPLLIFISHCFLFLAIPKSLYLSFFLSLCLWTFFFFFFFQSMISKAFCVFLWEKQKERASWTLHYSHCHINIPGALALQHPQFSFKASQ